MTASLKNLRFPHALSAGFLLLLTGQVPAQTLTNLHKFANFSEGSHPFASVILSGNTLYGTTIYGGVVNYGSVFKVNTDGAGFTNLHIFTGSSSGGSAPYGGLVLLGNTLYGTSSGEGSFKGTVFKINTDGTGFTNFHTFLGFPSEGANPIAGLVLSGNAVCGTTQYGGSSNRGTVFAVNTDGIGFTNLHSFTGSDGSHPFGTLILSSNSLYGTTRDGGSSDNGTVFAVSTDGSGFTNLYNFTARPGSATNAFATNSDGALPYAQLVLLGNTLYGTAGYGGSSGRGTVFAINTDGSGFTNVHSFVGSDGSIPQGSLLLSGNSLIGTARDGGSSGYGTVFAMNTDGTGFTTLYNFTYSDGTHPQDGLISSGRTLYGTANLGGVSDYGTVFSLSLPLPQLTITAWGADVILTWPANVPGFTLQSTTNLVLPAFWSTVSPEPIVVNGQNAVTNPISGTQKFYRLSQ